MARDPAGKILHGRRPGSAYLTVSKTERAAGRHPASHTGAVHALQEIRQYRSIRFGTLPRHDDLRRRWRRHLGQHRHASAGGRRQARRPFARCGHQFHRYRRRLRRRPVGDHHRPGAEEPQGAARERRRRDEDSWRNRHQERQFAWRVALSHHRRRQGESQAPATRSRRPVPDPRLRSGDADRRDAARARQPRRARARALYRRVELGGVADREGARHLGAARARALRIAAGVLHDRRARSRARTRAAAAKRGRRAAGMEPARGRLPLAANSRAKAARKKAAAARSSTSRR